MRLSFFIVTLILLPILVKGQDLIVKTNNDSIHCTIRNQKNGHIHYSYYSNNQVFNTKLSLDSLKRQNKNFYEFAEIPDDYKNYEQFRFAFRTGVGHQFAPIHSSVPKELIDHIKNLRNGLNIGLDATYFLSEYIGVGMNFNRFTSSNSTMIRTTLSTGYNPINYKDDITVLYIGPSATARLYNATQKNHLYVGISYGFINYKDLKETDKLITIKGKTTGYNIKAGYNISLNGNLGLFLEASIMSGIVTKFTLSDGNYSETIIVDNIDDGENLVRIPVLCNA